MGKASCQQETQTHEKCAEEVQMEGGEREGGEKIEREAEDRGEHVEGRNGGRGLIR